MTLADIDLHILAEVTGIEPGLEARVRALGLAPGAVVRVIRRAILHGPVLIDVHGRQLALGRGVARRVHVEPVSTPQGG